MATRKTSAKSLATPARLAAVELSAWNAGGALAMARADILAAGGGSAHPGDIAKVQEAFRIASFARAKFPAAKDYSLTVRAAAVKIIGHAGPGAAKIKNGGRRSAEDHRLIRTIDERFSALIRRMDVPAAKSAKTRKPKTAPRGKAPAAKVDAPAPIVAAPVVPRFKATRELVEHARAQAMALAMLCKKNADAKGAGLAALVAAVGRFQADLANVKIDD